jgi:imidazolonepropionase
MTLRVIAGGRTDDDGRGLLVSGARSIATMTGGLRRGELQADVAPLDGRDAWVACWDGRVVAVGPADDVQILLDEAGLPLDRFARLDAAGGLVTPGLIDPHTHLLFAGSREAEMTLRQQGAGYLEILAAGGGILSTVDATRQATRERLLEHGRRWLAQMLGHGTTTIEAKSGYGLELATELRLVDVAWRLGQEGPIDVVPTFLGAHAVPREFRDRPNGRAAYVRSVIEEQLPGIAAQGRARFCDVFCEEGVFSVDESRAILEAGRAYGLEPRLHADELAPSGGAAHAAELGAASADHLGAPSDEGIAAPAAAAATDAPVVATLQPATSWFLMKSDHAPARRLIDAGVPVALGSDFNPGTSPTPSLPLVMTLAVLELGMTAAEALVAVTINAARAVGLEAEVGSLEMGKQADLVVWSVPSLAQLPYWPAADLVRVVVKRGRIVLDRR